MKTFSEFLDALYEAQNWDKIDLSKHVTGMKAFSHGRGHEGYVYPGELSKNNKGRDIHKAIHKHALASGYAHIKSFPEHDEGHVHVYTKGGGPYTDHELDIHTNKAGRVWHIAHHTRVDKS